MSEIPVPPTDPSVVTANWQAPTRKRIAAFFIDFIIAGSIILIEYIKLYSAGFYFLEIQLLQFLTLIAYELVFDVSAWQGTPGKRLLGLKVTDVNGNRLTLRRAFGRAAIKLIGYFTLGAAYLIAFFSVSSQALHDLIAGSVVSKRESTLTTTSVIQPSRREKLLAIGSLFTLLLVGPIAYGQFVEFNFSAGFESSSRDLGLFVVSTTPADNSDTASVDSEIKVEFSVPVSLKEFKTNFSVLPDTTGKYSQGSTPEELVFKPDRNFTPGTSVSIVLNKNLTSEDGQTLNDDYKFSFLTAVSDKSVVFLRGGASKFTGTISQQEVKYKLEIGNAVPKEATVKTYLASVDDLLSGFLYETKTDNGGSYEAFKESTVNTSKFKLVSDKPLGDSLTFKQDPGVYYLEVSDKTEKYGSTWVNVTDLGVVIRQDDQKVVVTGQNLKTGSTDLSFEVSLYRLKDKVTKVMTSSVSGKKEIPYTYPDTVDMVVASLGSDSAVIPLSIKESNADLKVVSNLSNAAQIFIYTDRPSYVKGDAIKFRGIIRTSNDLAYQIPTGAKVRVWLNDGGDSDQTLTVNSDGVFSGEIRLPDNLVPTDEVSKSANIYVDLVSSAEKSSYSKFGNSFEVMSSKNASNTLTVNLDKSSYYVGDKIIATLTGKDNAGKPLTGAKAKVTVYSNNYQVLPKGMPNYPRSGSWGSKEKEDTVTFDSSGTASYVFVTDDKVHSDQELVFVVKNDDPAGQALSSKSAVVYQGSDDIYLFPSRNSYRLGDSLQVPFTVMTNSGDIAANTAVNYQLIKTEYNGDKASETIVGSGNLTTDDKGFGQVKSDYSSKTGSLSVRIYGSDSSNRTFEERKSINIIGPDDDLTYSGLTDSLVYLNAVTDKVAYVVGDKANITISSPDDQSVFVSWERGRIYRSEWVKLVKGANNLSFDVTSALAPGFSLIFSHFNGSQFISEGLPVIVNDPTSLLTVQASSDKASYAVGDKAQITISVKDSTGNPVVASIGVGASDASIYSTKLANQTSLPGAFLSVPIRGTNGSSSLTGIGSWGGRCGGGADITEAKSNYGSLAMWSPTLQTDQSGQVKVEVPIIKAGNLNLTVYSSTVSAWGQSQLIFGTAP